jgi:proteasome lid subunit RPN8/RPN11
MLTMTSRGSVLGAGVAAAIRRHGEQTYPHECCGALIGAGGQVTTAVALPNTTEEGPRRRFLVRPSDYMMAEKRASELGVELLGFYHSHPDHPARPSPFDLDHAWPNFAYVIVAVASGTSKDMTVWFLKDDRSSFEEGDLNGDENIDTDTASALHG